MTGAELDTIVVAAPGYLAAAGVLTRRVTRLVNAIETLTRQMAAIVEKVDDHEKRITRGGL